MNGERIWTVVVNWRQPDATIACLASLARAGAQLDAVVVVDNEATGELERRLRDTYPSVRLIPQATNTGFARAVNVGARQAIACGATAVLLLNNDAELVPGAMDALARDPTAGVLTAKILLAESPDRLWAVGGVYTGRRVIELGAREPDVGTHDTARLDFVYGCAMVVRADVFRDIGGFDERYFLYYEDIDLCLRAQAAGWRIAMVPNAHVLHEGSKSTEREPTIKVYHHARSRMMFFARHLRASRVMFAISEVLFLGRTVGAHILSGELASASACLRGTWDALRWPRARPTTRRAVAAPETRSSP